MEKVKTRKEYFTPAGNALNAACWVIFIMAFVYVIASHVIWPSLKVNGLFTFLLVLAYNLGLLSDVLCLYAGHWSERTQRRLNITAIVICLPLLFLILSLFKVECAAWVIPLLIVGNIMEYRLAGKMMKERQLSTEQ